MDNKRLESLDTLRGFNMMFIMGFSSVLVALCNLFPGGNDCALVLQMQHAAWNGFHIMDAVFPTFLFIAGISFPFSFAKQKSLGRPMGKIYWKIFRRALILILFGFIINGFLDFKFATQRYASVLGHIGLAWMISAILFINCRRRTREITAAVILVGYFLLLKFVKAPDAPAGADSLSMEGSIVGWFDRKFLPGRLYEGIFDPEGWLSLIPAVVTAMLGNLTGEYVLDGKAKGERKSLVMFLTALAMLAIGLVWSIWFPVNKNLWSSSFVLVAGAYALGLFSIFYYIIDVRGWNRWTLFFRVIGMNSITIYMAYHFISFGIIAKALFGGLMGLVSAPVSSLIYSTAYFMLSWLFLFFLYKKKVFLKV